MESAEETRKQASSTAKVELTIGQQFQRRVDTLAYQASMAGPYHVLVPHKAGKQSLAQGHLII